MQYLRSLLFMALFYPGTMIYSAAGIAAAAFGAAPMRRVVRGWAEFHHVLCKHVLGIRVQPVGDIPPGANLIAVKHQSMFETIEILRLARTPVIVIKRELADLPLFGRITRLYGVIPVDREAGAKALRNLLAEAKIAAASGRPVVIFPEGTRVRPGETPELRPGFAGLYRALGLPVVAVAVDSGRLWGRGVLKRPGTIHFDASPIMPPGLPRADIEARVHAAINKLEKLPAQPRP
ncbi:1-acyl-sn-glycerol-3-phosphate acyltransferase [Sphingomonas sp.]|uniref:lysophospholipid acyltransferase family protein n=1 Tax=Sphingomonas sp. TaxID=28214 RepID=UPI00286E0FAE|nr:1-acyl-sn-glycerol-3-phosphate acyltransferase [Sphingomonas sp.]